MIENEQILMTALGKRRKTDLEEYVANCNRLGGPAVRLACVEVERSSVLPDEEPKIRLVLGGGFSLNWDRGQWT